MHASLPEEIAPPRRPYRRLKTKAADGQATSGAAASVVVALQQAQAQPQAFFVLMLHQPPLLQAQPTQQQQQPSPPMMCYIQCCPPDVVLASRNGPRGRSVAGFMATPLMSDQSYSAGNFIICTCHGETFSPAGFLLHAGATDLSNPMRQISAFPWLAMSTAPLPGPPGGNNGGAAVASCNQCLIPPAI